MGKQLPKHDALCSGVDHLLNIDEATLMLIEEGLVTESPGESRRTSVEPKGPGETPGVWKESEAELVEGPGDSESRFSLYESYCVEQGLSI